MNNLGIVEGFFGPAWSTESRLSWSSFLQRYGGSFYIYAPKQDSHLRKAWREEWNRDYLDDLRYLKTSFQEKGVKFGVALSPFGLGREVSAEDWYHLKEKLQLLKNLGIDYLGLFFDDMPSTEDLLKVQKEVVDLSVQYFPEGLIFCPSYYSYDPILDKVFGQRPVGYVEGLSSAIPQTVDICWTGPKVISEDISRAHLEEVRALLERGPFIWENLYANDGPKNCKFLKLKYFQGRDESLGTETRGVAFNLMNQPHLSQVLYLSSVWVLTKGLTPQVAFEQSCFELLDQKLAQYIIQNRENFLTGGLDNLSEEKKEALLKELENSDSAVALEIKSWLKNEYQVGPECLTD